MDKTFQITPKTITKFFLYLVGLLLLANLGSIISEFVYPLPRGSWFGPSFYFDREANFPALYSALAILFCSVLLWRIGNLTAEKAKKQSPYWKMLSGIFLFLAMDEFLAIHEYLIEPTQRLMNLSASKGSFLYFGWFIPYCLAFGLIGLFLLRFFFRLPYRSRILFALAGVIFVSGAVGMEMIGGRYWTLHADSLQASLDGTSLAMNLTFALIATAEELLEMLGIVLFIYALSEYYLEHMGQKVMNIQFKLASNSSKLAKPADITFKKQRYVSQVRDEVTS